MMMRGIDDRARPTRIDIWSFEWKAYCGDALILHIWTQGCSAFSRELSAFRTRLARGDFTRVEVCQPAAFELRWTIYPRHEN